MDFQKVHWWPRPVRIRLQGSEPGTVCQSFLDIKNAASYKTMRQIGGPRGIRTLDLSDANRTLSQQYRFCAHLMHCEKKSTYIRLYKMLRHPNDLSRSQVWSPSRGFSRWCSLGRNMVDGQVSYRPLRCNSHGVQMYRISIRDKIRCIVKAQLQLWMNGSCAFIFIHNTFQKEDAYG